MKKEKKYALVLSGGGFNGAFQLGAINYLHDNWKRLTGSEGQMKFDIIAGVSVGAINGSMLAMNKLGKLNQLWYEKIAKNGVSEIYTTDFIDTNHKGDQLKMKLDIDRLLKRFVPDFKIEMNVFKKLGMIFSKKYRQELMKEIFDDFAIQLRKGLPKFKSLGDNAPLKLKLQEHLDKDKLKGTEFLCGFVSLDTGHYHSTLHSEFSSNEDFVNGVLASACIPLVWEPVQQIKYLVNNNLKISKNNIDGGVNNVSPLGDVVKRINADPDECEYQIIIINCHSGSNIPQDFTDKNIFQIATRSLYEIAFTEIFNNDVKHFLRINDLVKQVKEWDQEITLFDSGVGEIKAFDSIVIQPHPDMDLGHGLVANERLIHLRAEHGELMAQMACENNISKGGDSWK